MKQVEPILLSQKESARLRDAYVAAFLDTSSKFYEEHVATKSKFSDGMHATGYLWDCIPGAERITEQRLKLEVARHEMVFVITTVRLTIQAMSHLGPYHKGFQHP